MKKLIDLFHDDTFLIRRAPWMLLILGLLVLLPGTHMMPLIDRDEPRFAQAAVEMIDRTEWVIPYFNGEYRFDKPPLSYWMMRGGYALFGINEFGARAHSVVCAIALAIVLYYAGRRWFSARTGFLAGAMSLTAVQTLIHGRSCVADMPMVLAVALTCIALYELLANAERPYPWSWFWTLHLSLAAGFLAKGPIAWAVPVFSLLLLRFALWRKPLPWKRLKFLLGLPVILLPVAAWGIPALIQTGGAFWNIGIGEHVVERGMDVFNARKFIPGYYLPMAFISLFPWIALLGLVWRLVRIDGTLLTRWLIAWFLAPYIIFSLYLTQLPHYVMPGFAAFFLLLAEAIEQNVVMPKWGLWIKRATLGLVSLVALAALAAAAFIKFPPAISSLRLCLLGLALALTGLARLLFASKLFIRRSVALLFAGFWLIGAGLRPGLPGVALRPLFEQMPVETEYAFRRYTEPHLVFYSHGRWTRPNDLQKFLDQPGPRMLVTTEKQLKLEDFIKGEAARDFTEELDALNADGYETTRFEGFNPARSALMTLRIYYRR